VNRIRRCRVFISASLLGMLFGMAPQAWALPPATTTSLTMSSGGTAMASGGSVASGSVVTLTATVKSGSTGFTVGQVNFCDASASYCTDIHLLGTAQLTSAGAAVMRFRPGVGSHSYKAVFVGTKTYAGSSSSAFALTVTGTVATGTAITSSGTIGDYTLGTTVSVSGKESTGGPTGNISFLDTTNNTVLSSVALGSPTVGATFDEIVNSTSVYTSAGVVVADFDGDGNLDMAVSGGDSLPKQFYIFRGDGNGNFTAVGTGAPVGPGSPLVVQDFNGDGFPDLLVENTSNFTVNLYLGNGDGTFRAAPGGYITEADSDILAGDFNGDGIPDFAVASGNLTIFLGKGDGTFTELPANSSTVGMQLGLAALGDVNGDGIPDIVAPDYIGQRLYILLGNGDGTFAAAQGTPMTMNGDPAFAVGDFNGDGKLDIAAAFFAGWDTLSILRGNGDGTFEAAGHRGI